MDDTKKAWLAFVAWTFLILFIGIAIGEETVNASREKEIIELSIELTKLEIEKLKGGNNGL